MKVEIILMEPGNHHTVHVVEMPTPPIEGQYVDLPVLHEAGFFTGSTAYIAHSSGIRIVGSGKHSKVTGWVRVKP